MRTTARAERKKAEQSKSLGRTKLVRIESCRSVVAVLIGSWMETLSIQPRRHHSKKSLVETAFTAIAARSRAALNAANAPMKERY